MGLGPLYKGVECVEPKTNMMVDRMLDVTLAENGSEILLAWMVGFMVIVIISTLGNDWLKK